MDRKHFKGKLTPRPDMSGLAKPKKIKKIKCPGCGQKVRISYLLCPHCRYALVADDKINKIWKRHQNNER